MTLFLTDNILKAFPQMRLFYFDPSSLIFVHNGHFDNE